MLQNQVILSLGSNIGEKLRNLEVAISCIHESVGTVVKVSKVYETPSWGFESDSFLNLCLAMHSNKTAIKILDGIQEIEKK